MRSTFILYLLVIINGRKLGVIEIETELIDMCRKAINDAIVNNDCIEEGIE